MSRNHHEWTDRLSEYLAGELDESEHASVEAHLAECASCREVLVGVRRVVERAAELPDLEPPRDLWPEISAGLGGSAAPARPREPHVIQLPSARSRAVAAPRWTGLGPRGLVAAAAGLVLVSVSATWWVMGAGDEIESVAVETVPDPVRAVDTGSPPADLAGELAALEEILEAARGTLDPNTVLVLERNLGVIERAIADSREALAVDPGNGFLAEHLERMYRRKLVYLQDAVRVVQWSG